MPEPEDRSAGNSPEPSALSLARVRELLAPWAQEFRTPEPGRLDVVIRSSDLLNAVRAVVSNSWGYLAAITGLDPAAAADLEVLYQFCAGPHVLTLRVRTPRAAASVPSVCDLIPSASVFERELSELFGITLQGASDTSRLLLPEDWPVGIHPLRKDTDLSAVPSEPPARPEGSIANGHHFRIPIGPQHPALKEPGHFEFGVDGEIVTTASVRLGYAHRGIEKATESRSWIQNLYLLERVCGICSHVHALAYCLGVERLAGVHAPPRAQAIRELVAELERIHSHLLWLGVTAHEAGFETLFMYAWRDRETIMDVLEGLTGNRVNYSANLLGGVKVDVDAEQADAIRRGVDFLEGRTQHYLEEVAQDETFLRRTRGIGVMSEADAEALGVVGPTARASGVPRDIRTQAPYVAYPEFPVVMSVRRSGDLESRVLVRLLELFECYRVIRALLDDLPDGPLVARMPRRIPAGETISRVEAPRGELFYFIKSNGTDKPERIKIRTPTLCNMASAVHLAIGRYLADVPMLLAGIDPCFSCNDRAIVLRGPDADTTWTWSRLRQHGIEFYR